MLYPIIKEENELESLDLKITAIEHNKFSFKIGEIVYPGVYSNKSTMYYAILHFTPKELEVCFDLNKENVITKTFLKIFKNSPPRLFLKTNNITNWIIQAEGYGCFFFKGSIKEAEKMRSYKANYEHGFSSIRIADPDEIKQKEALRDIKHHENLWLRAIVSQITVMMRRKMIS